MLHLKCSSVIIMAGEEPAAYQQLIVTNDVPVEYSGPELLLFGLMLSLVAIALLLYLDGHGWIQRMVEERKKLRKALIYKPSDDRVTPVKDMDKEKEEEDIKDIIIIPSIKECPNETPHVTASE